MCALCSPNLILQSHKTAKYAGQIPHHDDDETDHGEGDEEAGVAAGHAGGRDDGEDQLEKKNFKSKH